jgi:hypothetical protein
MITGLLPAGIIPTGYLNISVVRQLTQDNMVARPVIFKLHLLAREPGGRQNGIIHMGHQALAIPGGWQRE